MDKCDKCEHPANDGLCGFALTETVRDDVGIFARPSFMTRTLIIGTCKCEWANFVFSICG